MYHQQLCERTQKIDGIGPWYWLQGESGAWDGPAAEFPGLKDKILAHTKQRRTIVCAGGCLGMYPRLWSQYFDRVITFEPCPKNFFVLTLNCQSDKIFKFNAALGIGHDPIQLMRVNPSNVGQNTVVATRPGAVNAERLLVPQMEIDDLWLEDVDVIQLDCEEADPKVLIGAWETIRKSSPVISAETVDLNFFDISGYRQVDQNNHDKIFVK